jgi:hypothetical protein
MRPTVKLLENVKRIYTDLLPPTLFFLIAFSLILATQQLIMRDHDGDFWTGFSAVVIGALMVGKIVLIVDKLPFVNKFPDRPLIYNTAWKSLIYFLAALLVRYLEKVVPLLTKHESLIEANRHLVDEIMWSHFWLIQMWLAVLFTIFCALRELVRVIGRERVLHMFFGVRRKAN